MTTPTPTVPPPSYTADELSQLAAIACRASARAVGLTLCPVGELLVVDCPEAA